MTRVGRFLPFSAPGRRNGHRTLWGFARGSRKFHASTIGGQCLRSLMCVLDRSAQSHSARTAFIDPDQSCSRSSSDARSPSAALMRPILSSDMLVSARSTAPMNVRWTSARSASSSWLRPSCRRAWRTLPPNTRRRGESGATGTAHRFTDDAFISTA